MQVYQWFKMQCLFGLGGKSPPALMMFKRGCRGKNGQRRAYASVGPFPVFHPRTATEAQLGGIGGFTGREGNTMIYSPARAVGGVDGQNLSSRSDESIKKDLTPDLDNRMSMGIKGRQTRKDCRVAHDSYRIREHA
jgi:hypothetical protein